MSRRGPQTSRLILATLFVFLAIASGCSLHYHQQADSQTLDVEIMRPTSAAGNANRTGTEP